MKRERSHRARRGVNSADVELAYVASRLRRLAVGALCAKVALVPLVFDASLDMPFTVSKAVLSHGLAWVLAGLIGALLIQFGRSAFVWSWLHVPVVALLAAQTAATVFAEDRSLALYGTHARMLGLATTADCVVLYFAIVLLVRTRKEAFALAMSGLAAASVVLAYEAVQLLGEDPFRWAIDSAARPFSTLGQSTALAQYLTTLAIAALACGLLVDRIPLAMRALALAYSGLLLLGATATGTRSAFIGVAAGSVALLLFIWLRHPSPRARPFSVFGAASAAAILGSVLLFTPLGARLASTVESPQVEGGAELLDRLEPSAAGRLTLYEIGVRMVGERPLFGYGPDNFTVGVPRYRPEGAPAQIRQSLATSAHSWIVQVAATSGIVGLMCFLGIAIVALALALSPGYRPAALVGAAMIAAFLGTGLTTVNEVGTDWLFWAAAGTIAAPTARDMPITAAGRRAHGAVRAAFRRGSTVVRIAPFPLVLLTGFLALSGWSAVDASRAAHASQDARQQGDDSRAIDLGLRATQADGRRASYWDTLGLAYVGARRWQEASNAFDRARRLAPYDVRYLADLVQSELLLANAGDRGAGTRAVQYADEGVRIDPNNPRPHLTRAVAMQVAANLPEALRSIERALALDPGSVNAPLYVTAAQIMLASNRPGDAIRVAREGLAVLGRSRSSVPIRIELARALVATGKPADALAELDIALSIQPNDPAATRLRAEIQAAVPR